MTETVIEAEGLGLRHGRRGGWALRDCSFRLPAGRVCALVGPNGAGKSSLLGLVAGLALPTEGTVRTVPRETLAYVGQNKPLYPQFTVGETLRMGRELNPGRWDAAAAERIVGAGGSTRVPRSVPSPAGSAPASPWPWPSASAPTCCSSTSRWPTSTRSPGASSWAP